MVKPLFLYSLAEEGTLSSQRKAILGCESLDITLSVRP
jgi:hypothetical protein